MSESLPRRAMAIALRRTRLGWWVLRSNVRKVWLRGAYPGLTIGRNVRLDPTAHIAAHDGGRIVIGEGTEIGANATVIATGGFIDIGPDSHVGIGATIISVTSIRIGADALLAQYTMIRDQDHGTGPDRPYRLQRPTTAPVVIGDNVWMGAKASVLKGVTIGDNCIVGANAVVSRDLEADTLAVGVPARVIRKVR